MKNKSILFVWALGISLSLCSISVADGNTKVRFRVTVKNLMAANVLSPFLAVIHKRSIHLFEAGLPASPGLALLAETGNRAILEEEIDSDTRNFLSRAGAEGGPILPGESRSVEISVREKHIPSALLDIAAMIGRSNDTFISTGGVRLKNINSRVTIRATNFDAGTEENTGNLSDFGPAGHPVEGAEGFVSVDRGLNLRGDAPEKLGWGSLAATITIERY